MQYPESHHSHRSKVPEITALFWVIKICATTLGETGGDVLSMTLNLGCVVSTAIFFALFLVAVFAQVRARFYQPFLYWTVILATTTAGTTMSDYLDRTAGLGYVVGSMVLMAALACILLLWRSVEGSVSFKHISSARTEVFYWFTILFSNTLGTALGDFMADSAGLGYRGGALVFGAALAVIAFLYFMTNVSRVALFWSAFILTRPLGATLGDELTKSHAKGGLDLGTIPSSIVVGMLLIALIVQSRRSMARRREVRSGGTG